jgi:hypothetical protein
VIFRSPESYLVEDTADDRAATHRTKGVGRDDYFDAVLQLQAIVGLPLDELLQERDRLEVRDDVLVADRRLLTVAGQTHDHSWFAGAQVLAVVADRSGGGDCRSD